jgi:hypothetical protein
LPLQIRHWLAGHRPPTMDCKDKSQTLGGEP